MGWQCFCGDIDVPELTEREHCRQLLLKERLRQAVRTTLSEKLERILQELQDNWTELEAVLHRFIEEELQCRREQEVAGLDPKMQAPFFGLLKEVIEANSGAPLTEVVFRTAVDTTTAMVAHMQDESDVLVSGVTR